MSDGPHRSLPMKPKWRSVAERAWNGAFGIHEISAAMMPALRGDCQDEIPPRLVDGLLKIVDRQEGLLFKDVGAADLEALRSEAGTGMGRHALDNLIRLSKQEQLNVLTLAKAFDSTFLDRLAKTNRQMEEHTLRNAPVSRTNQLRSRLEQAASHAKTLISGLTRQILKLDNNRPARLTSKRDGLDDGPSIK
jgi:hypothetical protein